MCLMLYMYHVHVIVYANKDDDDYYYMEFLMGIVMGIRRTG